MPGYTEEELFDILAPDLDQLVNKIKIARVLQLDSDQYDKISASPEGKNLFIKTFSFYCLLGYETIGLKLKLKDYYEYLRNYCFSLRY